MRAELPCPGFHTRRSGLLAGALLAWGIFSTTPVLGGEPPRITLDDALRLGCEHNQSLQAARTTIDQSQAQEVTAGLRPNPVLSGDLQSLPILKPGNLFSSGYFNETAQFDLGIGYTFERGGKRDRRLQASRDQTAVTKSQVSDNERGLAFTVATQFVNALLAQSNLDFALEALKSYQRTVEVSDEQKKAGDISEGDRLKIKLQLLQFQSDVSAARLAKAQALVALRELLGYESVPAEYDVQGELEHRTLAASLQDLRALGLENRPDVRAARQGVTAAKSQYDLAKANGVHDLEATLNLMHVGGETTAGVLFSFPLPVFDRNQGEIARAGYAVTQAEHLAAAAAETVVGDIVNAYEALRSNEAILALYREGYLDQAKQSREISAYAYQHGAASLLDLLDAERSYRSIQLAYRQTLASSMLAIEQLRWATAVRSLR